MAETKASKELLYSEFIEKQPVELSINNSSKQPQMKFAESSVLKRAMDFLPKMKEAEKQLQNMSPEDYSVEKCDESEPCDDELDIYVYSNISDDGNEGDDESSGDEQYLNLKKRSKNDDSLKNSKDMSDASDDGPLPPLCIERMKAPHSKMVEEM